MLECDCAGHVPHARWCATVPVLLACVYSGTVRATPPPSKGAASSNEQPGEIARRCGGKVEVVSGCLVCTKCGRGKKIAETCTKNQDTITLAKEKGVGELTELQRCLKRGAESLRIANNVLGFGKEAGPDHVPAWTKRQRL